MKRNIGLIAVICLMGMLNFNAQANAQSDEEDELVGKKAEFKDGVFVVYVDSPSRENHYIPSGWMGDYGDIKLDQNSKENPHSGKTCIKFEYTAKGKQGAGWSGVTWQNPANNWGEKKGGFDLRGATKLTFWARGEKGGERIMEFKMGGVSGTYADTDSIGIGPIDLTSEWQKYTIEFEDTDLSYISGGFVWATNADSNPDGCIFYLDDIQYEQ